MEAEVFPVLFPIYRKSQHSQDPILSDVPRPYKKPKHGDLFAVKLKSENVIYWHHNTKHTAVLTGLQAHIGLYLFNSYLGVVRYQISLQPETFPSQINGWFGCWQQYWNMWYQTMKMTKELRNTAKHILHPNPKNHLPIQCLERPKRVLGASAVCWGMCDQNGHAETHLKGWSWSGYKQTLVQSPIMGWGRLYKQTVSS